MIEIATLSLNTVPPLSQETQFKIVLCKEEGVYSFCTETPLSSVYPKSSEMDRKTVEVCSLVRQSPHWYSLFFGKILSPGRRILCAKDENDQPDCYQRKVQKPASVMVWGCISAHGMGDLHICEGTIMKRRIRQRPLLECWSSSSPVYTKNGQKFHLQNYDNWSIVSRNLINNHHETHSAVLLYNKHGIARPSSFLSCIELHTRAGGGGGTGAGS